MLYLLYKRKHDELFHALRTGTQAILNPVIKNKKSNKIPFSREILADEVSIIYPTFSEGSIAGPYRIEVGTYCVASWKLTDMPGCHGLLIAHAVEVQEAFRGIGLGSFYNWWRTELAKLYGYGGIISTDRNDNAPQVAIMDKSSYVKLYEFKNPKTGNTINIHLRPLNQ